MYLLFDIGGTKTRVALSRDGKTIGEPIKFDTPELFEEGIEQLTTHCLTLAQGEKIEAVAGGIAGALNQDRTGLAIAPNVPTDWAGKPLTKRLEQKLDVPVYLENDTAIVGLGEAHSGAGSPEGVMVYVTVSTGVGGARIVDGHIDTSYQGFEIGHQIIDIDASACADCTPCPSCRRLDLEGMVSGSATKRRFNKKPYEIPQEDPLWEQLAGWLAVGLNNTIVHFSPKLVVVGGPMVVGDPAILLERVEAHLAEILTIFPEKPELRKASLKDDGGLYGALAFVAQRRGMVS